jgi:hypothetical protein
MTAKATWSDTTVNAAESHLSSPGHVPRLFRER